MDENPYKAPVAESGTEEKPAKSRRKRTVLGYFLAALVGMFLIAPAMMPFTAVLDDAGGTQIITGVFVCVVIYRFLF